MKFINRNSELNKLNELWEERKSQLVVIYGKRRVGKTELIKQFLKSGKGIYFLADKRTLKEQLLEFARVVGNFFDDEFVSQKGFADWLEAFAYLKARAKKQPFVVAIDEYPYLVETDSATTSVFQKGWDEHLKDTQAYLILCGSSISMMESELLSYKAPLYGRLSAQLLIEPMSFESSWKFFPDTDFTGFLSFYSVTGGMPAYALDFSRFANVGSAIESLCWDKFGLYHNEVNLMLRQELRTPNNYFAILKALSWGKTKLGEIASNTGLEPQLVNKYLDTLIRLQLVEREVPVTEQKPHKSRKGIYIIRENFIRFWFQYVYAYASDLEIGNIRQAKKSFGTNAHILEAIAYEQIARDHMRLHQDKLISIDKVGRYWDKNVEIDGIGLNSGSKQAIFMEAKWSNTKQDLRALNKLKKKAELVGWNKDKRQDYFVIYSKSGFNQDLLDYAKQETNVYLVHQVNLV